MKDHFEVDLSLVTVPEEEIIRAALPKGHGLVVGQKCDRGYKIRTDRTDDLVAYAKIENGKIYFDLCEARPGLTDWSFSLFASTYPTCNPERIVWQVYQKWMGGFSPCGPEAETADEAIRFALMGSLNSSAVEHGAYLVSFQAKFLTEDRFWTKTSQQFNREYGLGLNIGSMRLNTTNFELGPAK